MRNSNATAIVLGGGFVRQGASWVPGLSTVARTKAGVALAQAYPEMKFILSGGRAPNDRGGDSEDFGTEAGYMKSVFEGAGVSSHRLLMEDQSACTIGNAVLSSALYLWDSAPGCLHIVTSGFHIPRATLLFRNVLHPNWDIRSSAAEAVEGDEIRAANEAGGIAWTHRFFEGIVPGDKTAIIAKLVETRPYYGTLPVLQCLKAA